MVGTALQELGTLEGPVLVFGGAYSNLQAMDALIAEVERRGIPKSNVIHTGDVVAYCANPKETTERLKASGYHCLMGNCEENVGEGKHDCGCGFPEDSACNEYSKNWYAYVMKELAHSSDLKEWMASLPRRMEFVLCGRRLSVIHGTVSEIAGWIFDSLSDEVFMENFAQLGEDVDGIISGHSGIPYVRLIQSKGARSRLWLNAGVIGMPANDGTQRAWYAMLTPRGGDIEVTTHVLKFDADAAAEAVAAQPGLNRGYAEALRSGVWPSHDILPMTETMNTGVALKEQSAMWRKDLKQGGVVGLPCLVLSVLAVASGILLHRSR